MQLVAGAITVQVRAGERGFPAASNAVTVYEEGVPPVPASAADTSMLPKAFPAVAVTTGASGAAGVHTAVREVLAAGTVYVVAGAIVVVPVDQPLNNMRVLAMPVGRAMVTVEVAGASWVAGGVPVVAPLVE